MNALHNQPHVYPIQGLLKAKAFQSFIQGTIQSLKETFSLHKQPYEFTSPSGDDGKIR